MQRKARGWFSLPWYKYRKIFLGKIFESVIQHYKRPALLLAGSNPPAQKTAIPCAQSQSTTFNSSPLTRATSLLPRSNRSTTLVSSSNARRSSTKRRTQLLTQLWWLTSRSPNGLRGGVNQLQLTTENHGH